MSKATRPTRGKGTRARRPAAVVRPRVSDAAGGGGDVPVLTPTAKGVLVSVAIELHRQGGTPGVKSTVYKLADAVIYGMLCAYVDGKTSVEQVLAAYKHELRAAKVSDRSAGEWLSAVRRKYHDLHLDRVRAIQTDDGVKLAMQDPAGAHERLVATLYHRAQQDLANWDQLAVSERHAGLRQIELLCRLIETRSDTAHRDAMTSKIRMAIEAMLDGGKESISRSELQQILEGAAGLAPSSAGKAAKPKGVTP